MIVVRDVFRINPAEMKKAKELAKEMQEFGKRVGSPISRLLADLSGEYYTLILEADYASLADYEAGLRKVFTNKEWKRTYPHFRKLIRGGGREIFAIVE